MQIQPSINLYDINEEKKYQQIIDQQAIDYDFLVSLIQQYHPQYQANEIQIMVQQKSDTKLYWKFVNRGFKHTFTKNYQHLNVRFMLNPHIIQQDVILATKLQQTQKQYKSVSRILNKILNQPLDINIFWASPLYTLDQYQRKLFVKYYGNKNRCFINNAKILVNQVKYFTYVGKIIQTIKKSKKRIKLKMDLFQKQCFKKKNYSIVYLICHTEVVFGSPIRSLPEIQQKQINQQDSSQTNSVQPMSLPSIHKNHTKYQSSQKKKFMNLNKTKSGDAIKYKQKPKPNLSKYFLGQSPEGKLIEIHPSQFYKMLEDRSIDLLVMHTSYPYYHLDREELDKLKINNILLINSNPNYPDESVLYFLQEFFQKLLQFGKINQVYQNVIEDIAKKSPQFQCCCYHQHRQNCTSNDLNIGKEKKLTQKFYSSHYRFHQVRCNCENRLHNFHHCSGKRDNLIKQNYSLCYKYKKPPINSQFFYCCCSQFNQHLHSLKKKFQLYYSKETTTDIKIKADPGILNENQSIKWMDTIIQQQRLIGNQNVILKLLDCFVGLQNSQKSQKIFNIYGGPKTGRKFIARYFANMLVHRKKDIYTKGWIQKPFQSIKEIKGGGEDTFFIYVKKRLSKKNTNKKSQEQDQLPINIHCIIVTYDKIQINNSKIKILSAKSEILEVSDECPNYIKIKGNFNQEQKDKLKQYLKLTIKQHKRDRQVDNKQYYPYTFEKQQIYCILKQSIYNDISTKFMNACAKLPIIDLVLLALCIKFSQKQAENELSKIIEKLRQQIEIQNQMFTYNSFIQYFPLIFQQFYIQISKIYFEIMAIFILKTNSSDQEQRLFEATSINKNSLLYLGIKKKIQLSQFLDNSINKNLKKQKKQKIIDLQFLFNKMNIQKASLCFLRNCLLKHTIFLQLDHYNKILLIKLGILLVNNVIVAQKTQQIQKLLEQRPTLIEKKTSIENSLNEQEENNSSSTLWLQNIDLVSRQGLLYLLNRMESHIPYDQKQQVVRQALKIILQLLKLQIYLESKYEKQSLKQSVNETIQKLIQQIIQRLSRERQDNSIYAPYIDNVEFDCAVALIILHTNGGRTSLSVNAEKQIIKQLSVLGNIFNFSNLKRVISGEQMHQNRLVRNIRKGSLTENQSLGEKGRKFFVMKLCEDTAMFNRILDKISSTTSDENGRFNQLVIANQILDCLKLQKKCEPSSNPALCYDIIQNLCKKFKEINTQQFQSSYLSYLYQQLQEKIQATQKQLRLKTFIWMEINPTSSSQSPMVRNTIIQDFNKYSQEKRKLLCIKMKFNINNLKRIEQQKGCRFLCLNIEMPSNNQQQFMVQDQNGKTYPKNWKEIADIIKNIAVLNLFICLKKPKQFVQELLKYKQHVLYFNFLQLKDKKNQIKNLPSYYEKMIMIEIVRSIIYKMHFERQKIDQAVTNVLSTVQFISDSKQIVLSNENLSKIVKKHYYHPSDIDKTSQRQRKLLSHDNYYDINEINKIKYIQELCFREKKKNQNSKKPGQQITITFSFRKLVLGLIELFKIKHGFNKFIEIDFRQFTQKKQLQPPPLQSNNSSKSHSRSRNSQAQQEYQEHQTSQNILDIIRQKKILQFFYNTKQGFLIASDFNQYQKICKKWQKQQYKRLFVNPHELGSIDSRLFVNPQELGSIDSTIRSFQFKIKSGHEIHQLLICIIREL